MFSVMFLCRVFGWTADQVLGLPYKAIPGIMTAAHRLEAREHVESLRIALASGAAKPKYVQELMKHYAEVAGGPRKPKASVTTEGAFELLKGLRR